ncbi:hypothetical protein FRC09_003644 [Ceratobasidium sp. 395]|nr:hypothetical protein FRC09_003644 [Ceratobasidium sp. 395]
MILANATAPIIPPTNTSYIPEASPQTLPGDILVIIFRLLSAYPTELYAPLICSHVCAHWRRVAVNTPLLWSYVDTSRGGALTRMWLSRSAQVALDVRLWENPLDSDLMKNTIRYLREPARRTSHSNDAVIQNVKDQSYRWMSLDIAFCTMTRMDGMMRFLGGLHDTLHLESLTVGPMGANAMVVDEDSEDSSPTGNILANITEARTLFHGLNVRCKRLRIDAYPVCPSPILISPHLTQLEVFTGSYYNHPLNLRDWAEMLSAAPNLVHLQLVSFQQEIFDAGASGILSDGLPALERLELSGAFVLLTDLFKTSSLPKLEYLLLHSASAGCNVNERLNVISSISPYLRRLNISTAVGYSSWDIRSLRLLQEITLFEMRWDHIDFLLPEIAALNNLSRIQLERVWDMTTAIVPAPEHADVQMSHFVVGLDVMGQTSHLDLDSDNGSFVRFPELYGYPSSEETGSDESERSYGEDEGSSMDERLSDDSTPPPASNTSPL